MSTLSTAEWLLLVFLSIPILATLLSLIPSDHWTARVFDFPRPQIAVWNLLGLVFIAVFKLGDNLPFNVFALATLICAAYQFWKIAAYTPLRKPQVISYSGPDNQRTISVLCCNVLTPNRQADKLLSQIDAYQPDIVLTLETDQWWEQQLSPLEQTYPYTVKVPLENLYGMHLYSRFPLRDAQVHYRVRDDIPSIESEVQLKSGEWIRIFCLHPMPPSPTESDTSTERDGELLLVGKEIEANDYSCLVFGDLNDVAWSDTSRLFQRISGLLDPRIGRGLFNTFHAEYRLFRWPLDHIFHSNDFMVSDLKVLPYMGSDHFPVYGKFQYHPRVEAKQPELATQEGDDEKADDKIAAAEPIEEVEETTYQK